MKRLNVAKKVLPLGSAFLVHSSARGGPRSQDPTARRDYRAYPLPSLPPSFPRCLVILPPLKVSQVGLRTNERTNGGRERRMQRGGHVESTHALPLTDRDSPAKAKNRRRARVSVGGSCARNSCCDNIAGRVVTTAESIRREWMWRNCRHWRALFRCDLRCWSGDGLSPLSRLAL